MKTQKKEKNMRAIQLLEEAMAALQTPQQVEDFTVLDVLLRTPECTDKHENYSDEEIEALFQIAHDCGSRVWPLVLGVVRREAGSCKKCGKQIF